jgi:hypothetical protein
MRLILANFNNILGLNGCLNFTQGKPLLIYGQNIAGKSNIINMLRYCLIPKFGKEKRAYSEEKRLTKNEILLQKNLTGSVEVYFEQNQKLYKLYYYFSRKGKRVSQLQKLSESSLTELPIEDEEKLGALCKLEWNDSGASTLKLLKEKFVQIGIYPEILDVLISPSNVRNFSEAINGSVVRVPEIIATKISSIHANAGKYLDNLEKLYGVIVLEKDEFERRTKELRTAFANLATNLPEMKVDEIFTLGHVANNLEKIQGALSKELESMPEKASDMRGTLKLLSSEKYDIWTNAIDKIIAVMPKKEGLQSSLDKEEYFQNIEETLSKWKIAFEQLPPDSSPEGLLTFALPKYEGFDFTIFSNPDRIRSIFLSTKEAKNSLQKAEKTSERYRVPARVSEINDMIKSYDELLKALKTPSEPKGDPALISKQEEKTVVSIPLNVALSKMEYLRGIDPTPLIHRPEGFDEKKFKEEISRVQSQIGTYHAELREAKKRLSDVKKLLKKVKQLRDSLNHEIELLDERRTKNKKGLDKLVDEWKSAYHHLCEVFKLTEEEIDLSSRDLVDSSSGITLNKFNEAQEIFAQDLSTQLKNYPEIIEKYKGLKPRDIVKNVTQEFVKRIEEVTERQQEYRNVNEWILSNNSQIRSLENRNKTREIMTIALIMAQEMLSRIREKADIRRIIEELAEKLEENVKDVYSKIFPEDESFNFEHLREGQFLSTINTEPITHPSGSQRVAISAGIMLSLAETFKLPIILDEAFDRIDVNRLRFFSEYITGIASAPDNYHICLAGFTTFNIEKNPEVLPFVNKWKIYLIERTEALRKNIRSIKELSASD